MVANTNDTRNLIIAVPRYFSSFSPSLTGLFLALSGGGVAILAVTFTIIGIVAFVGALVALCIKSKNSRVESQHQSWPTENALPPGAMIQVPAYFMPPPPGPPPGPPPSGFQEQPPSFDEAVSEKRQS